ncbi:hypothetical protein NE236_02400 [Actinoallomurus purpureus]|uniref:hypothetical protein n=1 Tax=Actinoallomurus purpureus TaxID=478114 RepID=UPI0020931B52|nr:hypothetical protein [Actinoallomurus purpureus]MCO6003820.1 hypothetical protein [Actinoallomurus purpureus]
MRTRRSVIHAGSAIVLMAALAACGGGNGRSVAASGQTAAGAPPPPPTPKESNPPGDIPDSQVFVPFTAAGGLFTVKVPEGWARSQSGSATVFTDKLNIVRVEARPAASAPTVASARATELTQIRSSTPGFRQGDVTVVQRKAGPAVRITYRAQSPANPVTGKTIQDEVERYEFWKAGNEAILTLSGPVGADNVDPWRLVTDSLRWQR